MVGDQIGCGVLRRGDIDALSTELLDLRSECVWFACIISSTDLLRSRAQSAVAPTGGNRIRFVFIGDCARCPQIRDIQLSRV